jgi:hypothetical protein
MIDNSISQQIIDAILIAAPICIIVFGLKPINDKKKIDKLTSERNDNKS